MAGIKRGRADGSKSAAEPDSRDVPRANENRFQAIVDIAPVGIFHTDANGDVTYVNEKWCQLGGMAPDAAMGTGWTKAIHPDDREKVSSDWYEASKTKTPFENEYRYVNADGGITWCFVQAMPEFDETGEINGYVSALTDITERKRAEESLRQSEAELRLVTNHLPALITYLDTDQRFLFVNKTAADWFGLPIGEIVGKTVASILGKESYGYLRGYIDRALAGERVKFEATIAYPDGKTRNVQISYVPNFSEDGDLHGYFGLSVDLTAHKKTEAELKETEMYLTNAIESINDGFVYYDADARLVFCNKKYREFYPWIEDVLVPGAKLEAVARTAAERGQDAEEITDLEGWTQDRLEAFSKGRAPHEQHLRDGRWLLCQESRTSDGGFVGVRTDITERKRIEETLKESEDRFGALIENSPTAILIKDTEGRYLVANLCWHEWFNPQGREILGLTVFDFYPEKHAREIVISDRQVVETGTVVEVELVTPFADGTSRTTLLQKFPIVDSEGAITAVGGINTDITERKSMEERLHQAQKMETVGQLTGGLAHDFNNLLGVIMGNAELLADDLGEEDARVQAMIRVASRGADLTQRLLAFSRQQPNYPKAIEAGPLITGMLEMLQRTLGEAINIRFFSNKDPWTAMADPGLLEGALLNLSINARDAMSGTGNLVIEVDNAHLDESYAMARTDVVAGDYVMVAVSDTGTGMSPEVLERVFEPFYTTKDVGKGSGLGLSMVFGFARQSGGHVAIYSEEGRGTTVKLYLPRTREKAESVAVSVVDDVPRGRGETVLVVEDDRDVREFAVLLLMELGYRVLKAHDGRSGLAVLEAAPGVDLLLTDMVMPGGMTGRDLADVAVRRNGKLKVLFMSGYTEVAVNLNGWVDKGAELLQKPFRKRELATKVRKVLDRTAG